MPRTLAWRWAGRGRACQSGNMAILLTSLYFVFKKKFLPKYRVRLYGKSGALGYNVIGVYRWILRKF